jgi:hypothetical protein
MAARAAPPGRDGNLAGDLFLDGVRRQSPMDSQSALPLFGKRSTHSLATKLPTMTAYSGASY